MHEGSGGKDSSPCLVAVPLCLPCVLTFQATPRPERSGHTPYIHVIRLIVMAVKLHAIWQCMSAEWQLIIQHTCIVLSKHSLHILRDMISLAFENTHSDGADEARDCHAIRVGQL